MFPSHWELLIIFLVVLLLFGAKRIPEMARGLGKGIREFRGAVKDVRDEVETAGQETTPNRIATPASGSVAREAGASPAEASPSDDPGAPPAREEARN
ncbi:MAG: twin-arginine translocase TatA/TatE family subunit [Gemmatimonadaceae bacterium]|nr:twin-arginine translocase TatA/TatE family subunit [Gemmatimonadaceae bacterium]